MSGVITAVVGTAVVGGIVQNNASKRAAETAQGTATTQLDYMRNAEDRARKDINDLFPAATASRNKGIQQGMDFYKSALPATINAMREGNQNAQSIIAGSMPQMQNALMGGEIDYSFMQPKQQSVDMTSILAGLPQVYDQEAATAATNPNQNSGLAGPKPSPNYNDGSEWNSTGNRNKFMQQRR